MASSPAATTVVAPGVVVVVDVAACVVLLVLGCDDACAVATAPASKHMSIVFLHHISQKQTINSKAMSSVI
jgi:hypothetical protein